MTSRGFTLAELLITMVVLSILGVALAQILISNSRFVSRQDAMMEAREVARSAMNVITPELRLLSDGALIAAQRDSVRARVPYTFGVICQRILGFTYASVMPTDSVMYASAAEDGIAWQSGSTYVRDPSITVVPSAIPAAVACGSLTDTVRLLPGGQLIRISGIAAPPTGPSPGTVFYLFQNITYRFRPSVDLPGRRGLWRRAAGAGSYEELVAPFDTTARFAFLMGPNMQVDTRLNFTTQVALDSIRGLELRLVGASDYVPQGSPGYLTFDLRTSVTFLNRMN